MFETVSVLIIATPARGSGGAVGVKSHLSLEAQWKKLASFAFFIPFKSPAPHHLAIKHLTENF